MATAAATTTTEQSFIEIRSFIPYPTPYVIVIGQFYICGKRWTENMVDHVMCEVLNARRSVCNILYRGCQ